MQGKIISIPHLLPFIKTVGALGRGQHRPDISGPYPSRNHGSNLSPARTEIKLQNFGPGQTRKRGLNKMQNLYPKQVWPIYKGPYHWPDSISKNVHNFMEFFLFFSNICTCIFITVFHNSNYKQILLNEMTTFKKKISSYPVSLLL